MYTVNINALQCAVDGILLILTNINKLKTQNFDFSCSNR